MQGTDRRHRERQDRPSPLAPATGNGTSATLYDVRGVITQKTLARTSAGANQHGFFLQSRAGATDGDPPTSDGIFVFMGSFTTLDRRLRARRSATRWCCGPGCPSSST